MRMRVLSPYVVLVMLIAPAAASASFPHVIAVGESLSWIAATDGLTVQQLAAANGLSPDARLVAGATIQIPPQAGPTGQSSPATASDGGDNTEHPGATTSSYVVVPGDTLSAIAARAGVSVATLAAANGLDPAGVLLSGSALRVPGASSGAASTTPVSQPSVSGGAGGPPYPSNERLTGSQIAQIAAANGVPASLAQAIAWQESGFNNAMVSNANARGVMQIIPSTWDWIGQNLAPQPPLATASALDNVRGGVLLLHSLLASTGDPALAVASYYQGLGSVKRIGMLPETQRYVNDVTALARRFGGG
jgi:N-acetylmuramoyl-L-alanine amidase